MDMVAGIGRKARNQLAEVLRSTHGSISVDDVVNTLDLGRPRAAKLLHVWSRRGWIARIKRGLYVPLRIDSCSTAPFLEDPWRVAGRVFEPCFVAGWSAAAHWGLTSEVFPAVRVVTAQHVSGSEQHLGTTIFKVKQLKQDKWFGLEAIWRDSCQVMISNPTRTIADALSDPTLVDGFTMVEDVFRTYLHSEYRDMALLLKYCDRLGNRAAFKRLGLLVERHLESQQSVLDACRRRMSKGYTQLDPGNPGQRILTRWRPRTPESVLPGRVPNRDVEERLDLETCQSGTSFREQQGGV